VLVDKLVEVWNEEEANQAVHHVADPDCLLHADLLRYMLTDNRIIGAAWIVAQALDDRVELLLAQFDGDRITLSLDYSPAAS
jgi:hypothetical protein